MSSAARRGAGGPGAAMPAGDVHIERLVLHVAGLDRDAALALARLVAEGLASGLPRSGGVASLDSLQVEVSAGADQGKPGLLARRIIDEIGRVRARGRAPGGPDVEADL